MQDRDWQAELRLRRQREKKARQILGVSDLAGAEQTKRAWRRQSLKHHPDRNDGSTESHRRFILINCAYRFLSEGLDCKDLDVEHLSDEQLTLGKYRRDNLWGYFCWWRENYFP